MNSDIQVLLDDADEEQWEYLQEALSHYLEVNLKTAYDEWKKKHPKALPQKVLQIGGNVYQFFNQDKRETNEKGVIYDQLLLEYDCPNGTKYPLPLQGYGAVSQFFIRSEDLVKKKFS
jgi:uncharacterized protein YwqG